MKGREVLGFRFRGPETGQVIRPGRIPVTGTAGVRKRTILEGIWECFSKVDDDGAVLGWGDSGQVKSERE
jgi:hypothetical protein